MLLGMLGTHLFCLLATCTCILCFPGFDFTRSIVSIVYIGRVDAHHAVSMCSISKHCPVIGFIWVGVYWEGGDVLGGGGGVVLRGIFGCGLVAMVRE